MTTVENMLLILIASGFTVLLILAVIIAFTVLKILQNVRRISEKVELAAGSLGDTVRIIGNKVAPMAGTSVMAMVLGKLRNHKRNKED